MKRKRNHHHYGDSGKMKEKCTGRRDREGEEEEGERSERLKEDKTYVRVESEKLDGDNKRRKAGWKERRRRNRLNGADLYVGRFREIHSNPTITQNRRAMRKDPEKAIKQVEDPPIRVLSSMPCYRCLLHMR
jgi:hypothetical protein